MKLTVFGATGGIGKSVVDQAIVAGHDVTVLVRTPEKLGETGRLVRVVRGDVKDPDAVRAAITPNTDAVLFALGARPGEGNDIVAPGTRNIIAAMNAAGVRRLVGISASAIYIDRYDLPLLWFAKRIVQRILRKSYDDLRAMEREVRRSNLDWSIVVPPRLTDKPLTARYRSAMGHNVPSGFTVARADVAHCMLRILGDPPTFRELVFVAT
jgi:putative NADH-flavin reductase